MNTMFMRGQFLIIKIFCIHPSEEETTGVITLFRIGEEDDIS